MVDKVRTGDTEWSEYESKGNDFVPMEEWGRDHWSTLLYLETCAVDHGGNVDNRRMRCNPRLHRGFAAFVNGMIMDGSKYPTKLRVGERGNHDDWSCVEDFVKAGLVKAYFSVNDEAGIFGNLSSLVRFTLLGLDVVYELRRHKAMGGTIGSFVCSMEGR